jgi:ribosome biogenesis GTPase / thiamine phosphate phosphatase
MPAILEPMRLVDLGWDDGWAAAFAPWAGRPDIQPARVAIEYNHLYRLLGEGGEIEAVAAGRLKHQTASRSQMPAVGDWVAIRKRPGEERAAITGVLPRRSRFSRGAAGQVAGEQVVAANVDTVFIVMALDRDFNLRRLERYLTLVRGSGVAPVVALTKADLCPDPDVRRAEVQAISGDAPVMALALLEPGGADQVAAHLRPAMTAVLLGSSGVGKSTLLNGLVGTERQRTAEVREHDSRGRHTTTQRQMFRVAGGALVIDTPGLRELDPMSAQDGLADTFDDVAAEAARCKFRDCRHLEEPGCAVRTAIAEGRLAPTRLAAFRKLATPPDRPRR